jgi:hypothetical protein
VNYDRQNAIRNRDILDIHDVKWSHGEFSNYIATAATNGKVVIYDLAKPGLELARLHQHSRQVHKVAFNPHGGRLLLSASQDGLVLLWDLREAKPNVKTFRAKHQYNALNDGIRDVKWNPQDAVEFAIGTDDGSVQKWSFQAPNKPLTKIKAHDGFCTSIDWHPDGKHIISAGQDRHLKVWDVSVDDKRQKAKWSIRTPYQIRNAKWRYNSNQTKSGIFQCTQVATSYFGKFPLVHVWDFTRSYMPRHELPYWSGVPEDMLWASDRSLWSISKEGYFEQRDVAYAPRVIDKRPQQVLALSPTGEICVFHQKKPRRRFSEVEDPRIPIDEDEAFGSFSDRPVWTEEAIDDSLLSSSYKRHHIRALSVRSSKSAASTPPSTTDPEAHRVIKLNETLSRKGLSSFKQVAFRGPLDGSINPVTFSYLAQKYKAEALPNSPTIQAYLNIDKVFKQNASYAQKTASYRIAQTWRLLGVILTHELRQRAFINSRYRLLENTRLHKEAKTTPKEPKPKPSPLSPTHLANPAIQALQVESLTPLGIESTSNVTTPQARPHSNLIHERKTNPFDSLPDIEKDEFNLPPSLVSPPASSPAKSVTSTDDDPSHESVFEEPKWYLSATEINERKAQMSNWRATPKVPLGFDFQESSPMQMPVPPKVVRHNSDDSFAMLSMSSDSQPGASFSASLASQRSHRPSMSRIPEDDQYFAQPARAATIPMIHQTNSSLSEMSRGRASWFTSSSDLDSQGRSLSGYGLISDSNLEASQTIIPDGSQPTKPILVRGHHGSQVEPGVSVSDFQDIPNHLRSVGSVSTINALHQLLEFYTSSVPNAQAIYHIATVLAPIFLESHSKSKDMSSPLGIRDAQAESILAIYHQQLNALRIYNPSVKLARATFQAHPDLFDTSSRQIGFLCLSCRKPINNPNRFRCETCLKRQAPCTICWQKYPAISPRKSPKSGVHYDDVPPPTPLPILWQSCLICGHGAHATCLQSLQTDPRLGGKCPTESCLCDCIPGTWRNQLNREAAAAAEGKREARRNTGVRRDATRAKESNAAKGARVLLDGQGSSGKNDDRRVVFVDQKQRNV